MSWFRYRQNNSGGEFIISKAEGIDVVVFIEADNALIADARAESIGIYFDGVEQDIDCPCCGNRWEHAYNSDKEDWKGVLDWMSIDTNPTALHFWDGHIEYRNEQRLKGDGIKPYLSI